MVSLTLFGKFWKTHPKIQNNYGILKSKNTESRQNFEMTMSSLKYHLKSSDSKISRPTKISSAKKFQKFRKSAQLWLVNKSRS